jgi:protein-S-isoprenylcysteine O-methyltransferase Ste14
MRNLFETVVDVGSGLFLSTLIQLFIFPYFDLYPTVWESFNIAIIFTVISMIRSWFWRTIFTRRRINDNRNRRLQGIR